MRNPFAITPLLLGWTSRGYERALVAHIRNHRYMPELWDCNNLLLDYRNRAAEPHYCSGVLLRSRISHEPPIELVEPRTRNERDALSKDLAAALAKAHARRKAAAAERREQDKLERDYQAALRRRQAEQERRDREWENAKEQKRQETHSLLERRRKVYAWMMDREEAMTRKYRTELSPEEWNDLLDRLWPVVKDRVSKKDH